MKDEDYSKALAHIQHQCRTRGIEAALNPVTESDGKGELDALLLCDRKGAGQQLAAQAGTYTLHSSSPMIRLRSSKGILLIVYR